MPTEHPGHTVATRHSTIPKRAVYQLAVQRRGKGRLISFSLFFFSSPKDSAVFSGEPRESFLGERRKFLVNRMRKRATKRCNAVKSIQIGYKEGMG